MRRAAALLFAVAVSAGPRPAAAQDAPPPEVRRVLDGLGAVRDWQISTAREKAAEAYADAPDDPLNMALMGAVKMHLSDYAGAVELMREAERQGAPAGLMPDLDAAEAARVATDGFQEAYSDHFVIRYIPGRDEILVPYAIETLEKAYTRIGGLLGWQPRERIALELYPSAKTLAQVSSLTPEDIENSGTIALCRWNRLMATTPRAVMFGYSWRDTLAHELTHLIIGGASKNTVPIWLHEGIAKFAETAWRTEPGLGISVEQQEKLREAAKKGTLIPFEKMHPSMAKLPTQEQASLAFSEVFTFIEYLVDEKGWAGVRRMLTLMAEGKSDAEALEIVHGAPMDRMVRRWMKTLPKRPIKSPSGPVKGARKLVVKDSANVPDDELHGVDEEARRYARAADLLYARGRLKAAQTELQKAFDVNQSPLVAAKLAMVALHNGDMTAAEAAARKAMDGAPALAGPNVTLAEVLVRAGKPEAAKAPLSRAIDINPFDPRIHRLMLAVLGDGSSDPEAYRHAQRAVQLMQRGAKVRGPTLGKGALVQIHGDPYARVYLRPAGGDAWVATGMVTPTVSIAAKPGSYELMLLPPLGEPTFHTVEVRPTTDAAAPQIVIPGATGS